METRELARTNFEFPPGFRFHPSDEELIIHYLRNKVGSRPFPPSIIAEINLYNFNPWELPRKALFGDEEWFFFTPRDRKYPNGARPNRAAGSGYWKATGTDRPILSSSGSKNIGVKKALVFYMGRPPKGVKTDWIMNEYRLLDPAIKSSRLKGSMRLDDWVLCRVRQKGSALKHAYENLDRNNKDLIWHLPVIEEACPSYTNYENDMITECLKKDCGVLASILAGKTSSLFQTISSVSNQGSNLDNGSTSVYEDGRAQLNDSPITISSFNNYYSFKRKTDEETDNGNEDLQPREKQYQSEDNFYNPNMFDLINVFPEYDELASSSTYIQ